MSVCVCVCERESPFPFTFSSSFSLTHFHFFSLSASASNKDEFRKPQWFEEAETDDELFDDDRKFAFQVFTSPLEMQRHFERQLQRLLESVQESEGERERKMRAREREPTCVYVDELASQLMVA